MSIALLEATRNLILLSSKNTGEYEDQSLGKNRFERKQFSKIDVNAQSFKNLNMDQFFKNNVLEIQVPVLGETNKYTVTVKFNKILDELQREIKNNRYKIDYKVFVQAITKVFNTTDVYINCSCADFTYRFKYWSIVRNYGAAPKSENPGPGKGIVNPLDNKGKGCKHVLLVLDDTDWLLKVISVIYNYVLQISKIKPKIFFDIIFSKLFGMTAEEAKIEKIIPENIDLEKETDIINIINTNKI